MGSQDDPRRRTRDNGDGKMGSKGQRECPYIHRQQKEGTTSMERSRLYEPMKVNHLKVEPRPRPAVLKVCSVEP